MTITMSHPLDDARSEAIIAPFHEGAMARQLPIHRRGGPGCQFEHEGQVLAMRLRAVTSEPNAWAEMVVDFDLPLEGYDTLVLAATLPAGARTAMVAKVDDGDWPGDPAAEAVSDGQRLILSAPVSGQRSHRVSRRT